MDKPQKCTTRLGLKDRLTGDLLRNDLEFKELT